MMKPITTEEHAALIKERDELTLERDEATDTVKARDNSIYVQAQIIGRWSMDYETLRAERENERDELKRHLLESEVARAKMREAVSRALEVIPLFLENEGLTEEDEEWITRLRHSLSIMPSAALAEFAKEFWKDGWNSARFTELGEDRDWQNSDIRKRLEGR